MALAFMWCFVQAHGQWGLHVGGTVQSATYYRPGYDAFSSERQDFMGGVGYWHDTSPRTAWCLGLSAIGAGGETYGLNLVSPDGGSSAYYRAQPWVGELRFKSCYFLADNTEAAVYIGVSASLALHSIAFNKSTSPWTNPGAESMPTEIKTLRPVFPVCFHIGLRGDLRYVYVDWHVWAGYQVGAGSQLPDGYSAKEWNSERRLQVEPPDLTWGMGFAIGFGSDGRKKK